MSWRINPTQDYAVKHNSDSFIVFVPENLTKLAKLAKDDGKCQRFDAHLFSKSQGFDVDDKLGQSLTHAATANTKVEIIVDIGDSTSPPGPCKVKSIKIPASPPADK